VESARADFHVVRLEQCAALLVPVGLQGQDNLLKCQHRGRWWRLGASVIGSLKRLILAVFAANL
jgi:hypothetical protein